MLKTVCCVKKPSAFVRLMGFFMLRSTCQHLTIRQVLLLYPHCRIYEGGLYLKKRTGHRLLFSWKSYPGGQLLYTLFFAVSLATFTVVVSILEPPARWALNIVTPRFIKFEPAFATVDGIS